MNYEERTDLRSDALSSACVTLFDESRSRPGVRKLLCVELCVNLLDRGDVVRLILFDDRGLFERFNKNLLVLSAELDFAVTKYWFERLESKGLWELSDFRPARGIMDGYSFVVKGVDLTNVFQWEVDASLVCPIGAISRHFRQMDSLLHELFSLAEADIKKRNRLWRYRIARWIKL
jgi:hypothetical protein